ncbi:MAG: D-glycero-alpha-D-manno-heptose-1,7-bisphosphate 7-phosphatase [Gemmatimonadota bacterium]
MTGRPAAFLDRDGTLITDAHYPGDPAAVRIVPGAAAAIRRLNGSGIPVVVITNQSGIARGFITEQQYQATHDRMVTLFSAAGATIDATYHCPHYPEVTGTCDCRKPATGMYLRASRDLDLDPGSSLFVGDRRRDVEPALTLGGFGVLVPSRDTPREELAWAVEHASVATDLAAALAASSLLRASADPQ